MSKSTVTQLFIGANFVFAAGLVGGFIAFVAALASGVVTINGADAIAVNGAALAGTLFWLTIAALVTAAGAALALVSWIGALLNTAQIEDRTWFIVLLVLGLFSFGWLATIAYLVLGPDAPRRTERLPGIPAAQSG